MTTRGLIPRIRRFPRRITTRAFTLIELLVVIAIIAILIGVTVVAVGALAEDAKLATGKNRVIAALGLARGLAMERNEIVIVTFRPKIKNQTQQVLEVVFAEWSGESILNPNVAFPPGVAVVDRFVPLTGVEVNEIPTGIKVAQPRYRRNEDAIWISQSEILRVAAVGEAPNRLVSVMFDADGTLITRNSISDSNRAYIDFNNDGFQSENGFNHDNATTWPPTEFFQQILEDDEPFLNFAPMLAVYSDTEAREFSDVAAWTNDTIRNQNLTTYITTFVDPIHFNRYTGVAMK